MNILAINTSFNETYVAVLANKFKVFKQMDSSLKQSENVLGLIDIALCEASINLSNVDAVACVIGPGSFTGIRIGASLVKGFCTAVPKIKKIEICSLDLIAYEFLKSNPKGDFWVATNALSGNIFACKYSNSADRITEPFLAFGEDIEQISGTIVGLEEENLDLCNNFVAFSSEVLLSYAQDKAKKQLYSNDFIPIYLRKSQAEAELDKKGNN